MAADDRQRWDERHARAAPSAPDAFVLTALQRLAPAQGRALDLAAGTGRHALLLAERGYEVDAWDVSPVGLAILAARARAARQTVQTRAVDLDGVGPPLSPPWDLVVLCNYLDRGLLGELARWVRPGGYVLFTTFTVERGGARPPLERCLRRGELADGLPGLVTEHGFEAGGRAGILARRPRDAAAGLRPGLRR